MEIKKAILKVFSTNFIQLIAGIIVGFLVPSILPIDGYANLKTYTLYISYIGILHFGFADGLYIKYGGQKYEKIEKSTLIGEHRVLLLMELSVMLLLLIIGILKKDTIIILFSISTIPANLATFFRCIYQASGEFNKYSRVMLLYTTTYTISNIILALIIRSKNYIYYCLAIIVSNCIAVISTEIKFMRECEKNECVIPNDILKNIKTGSFILLGNLSVVALFGTDKWFVKLFLSNSEFAYYSFAVSMLNIVNILINAISITFYNYLFSNNDREKIEILKKHLIIIGGFASSGYFILAFIVETFIKKYILSLPVISIIFSIFPYMIVINALYVNLYKVNKQEKKYLTVVITMLIVSIIYNIIALRAFGTTNAIAFATVFTIITWIIYATKDLKKVNFNNKNILYCAILTTIFFITSHYFNWYVGISIYLIIYLVLTYVIHKDILINIMKMLNVIKTKRN